MGNTTQEQVKMHSKAWEGGEEEEEHAEGNPQVRPQPLVEAAFHCRGTRENVSVEQRAQEMLWLDSIVRAQPGTPSCPGATRPGAGAHPLTSAFPRAQPQSERMFYRGLGLNLTTGQYTAPVAGYYTFMATLHIAEKWAAMRGDGLCAGPLPAGQFASVSVDNTADPPLTVQKGSVPSAILLGV
ncbi:LOW QUALITY PROTEIN: erythroferrone [Pterocles gutturalis]